MSPYNPRSPTTSPDGKGKSKPVSGGSRDHGVELLSRGPPSQATDGLPGTPEGSARSTVVTPKKQRGSRKTSPRFSSPQKQNNGNWRLREPETSPSPRTPVDDDVFDSSPSTNQPSNFDTPSTVFSPNVVRSDTIMLTPFRSNIPRVESWGSSKGGPPISAPPFVTSEFETANNRSTQFSKKELRDIDPQAIYKPEACAFIAK
jgi:hypothetical protein